MSLQKIKGQDYVVELLQNEIQLEKIAHAYCFLGPSGARKRDVAKAFAKVLNCKEIPYTSCGKCQNCLLIEKNSHPGIIAMSPEGASIKIHQVRNLQKEASYKAGVGQTSCIFIDHAEHMTIQAANSLLRFLEEPSESTVIILMVENIGKLLPTIVSRCQVVRFHSDYDHRDALIQGIPQEWTEDQFAGLCQRVIEWGREIFSGKSFAFVTIQNKWFQDEIERNKGISILTIFLLWVRDCLHIKCNRLNELKGFHHPMWKDSMETCDGNRNVYLFGLETALHAHKQLSRFVQPQSVFEQMVLVIQEEIT